MRIYGWRIVHGLLERVLALDPFLRRLQLFDQLVAAGFPIGRADPQLVAAYGRAMTLGAQAPRRSPDSIAAKLSRGPPESRTRPFHARFVHVVNPLTCGDRSDRAAAPPQVVLTW